MMEDDKMYRISKLMSEQGICSRREAEKLIEAGMVFVNGERMEELGARFPREVEIQVTAQGKKLLAKKKTVIINKPVGYVSHADDEGKYKKVIQLIKPKNLMPHTSGVENYDELLEGLAPAGRLDIESQGMIVLTQDGVIAKQLIGENSKASKEYLVRVKGQMIEGGLELLRHGLELDGEPLKKADVDWLNKDQLKFVLYEGKKRQIRRMCEAVGLKVMGLKRVRIGRITLGNLKEGYFRLLEDHEKFI